MNDIEKLELYFDDLLIQTQKWKLTHEQLERGLRHENFEQVKEWKMKYGYKFNIYGNDHLINGEKHFHFENKEENVSCKIDFLGNILEEKGRKSLSSNILKELRYFLYKPNIKDFINELWDKKNK